MERIVQGSKEYMIVDVTDKIDSIATLDGTGPKFDIYDMDDTKKVDQVAATNIGMKLYCLVDTDTGPDWTPGDYRLYVNFVFAPEAPRLGPIPFKVDAP